MYRLVAGVHRVLLWSSETKYSSSGSPEAASVQFSVLSRNRGSYSSLC